jgi:2-dehydro-3-deoxyphosphogluconate aldolase/(4S)-4-hydroxy-2-oxoglutarate aldolase
MRLECRKDYENVPAIATRTTLIPLAPFAVEEVPLKPPPPPAHEAARPRPAIPEPIARTGVIAILRGLERARVLAVASALSSGGIEALEVTLDSPDALASIGALAEAGGVLVGAGTVLGTAAAERAVSAGARFLVAPDTDPELIAWAADRDVPIFPGAMTPTEIRAAWRAGAPAVKLFPASALRPDYLGAVAAPLLGVPLIPTGGITAENAPDWRAAGAVAVGAGGWLTAPEDLGLVRERAIAIRDGMRG